MDRQTLVNYGWIVVVALVIAVMLAFSTPFGVYVMDGVSSIASGYINASKEAFSEDNKIAHQNTWHDKWDYIFYYSSLTNAMEDVNAGTVGKNDDATESTGTVKVMMLNSGPVVTMLKDSHESTRVNINTDNVTLYLNGHTLTTNDKVMLDVFGENFVLDGMTNESTIKVEGERTTCVQMRNGNGKIKGGTYIAYCTGTENSPTIQRATGLHVNSNTQIQNVTINASAVNGAPARGIEVFERSENVVIKGCNISVYSTEQTFAHGILLEGSATVENTVINSNGLGKNVGIYISDDFGGKDGNIIIKNINININGGTDSIGIWMDQINTDYGVITNVEGGHITIKGAQNFSIGIYAENEGITTLKNTTINTEAIQDKAYGIYTVNNATVNKENCEIVAKIPFFNEQ